MLNDYERDKHKEHGEPYWLDLNVEQQLKAKIISGHDVNPEALSLIQPYCNLYYFIIIREPYSKLISAYNYFVDKLQTDKGNKIDFNTFLVERHRGHRTSAQFLIRFCGWTHKRIDDYIESNVYEKILNYITDKFSIFTFIADQAYYDADIEIICQNVLKIPRPTSSHFVAGKDINKTVSIDDVSTDFIDKYMPYENELYHRLSELRLKMATSYA